MMRSPIEGLRVGVANRGIPALRIGRTIREMGGTHVAFATDEDKTAPHVSKADKAYRIRSETRYLSPGGEGVRLDSCIFGGYEFPKAYDSLGSLLMTHGATWEKTLSIMARALSEYFVGGLKTTIPFHKRVIYHPRFREGEVYTKFIDTTPELMVYRETILEEIRLSHLMVEITAK